MEWFGELPERWESKRTAAILAQRKEKNDPVQTDFILSLSARYGVVPYSERVEKGGNKPKSDLTKYAVARENDLLVNCMNVLAGSSGVTRWDGAISPVYYALFPRTNEINIWYYNYIFRLITFYRSLIGYGKGILMHESENGNLNTIRLRIAMSNLNNVILPLPPREEQDQIVRYLDWKVSQINKLINVKKKQIALLQEQKQTVINQAVTKGLNSDTEMKDSGIEWLGEVPTHWSIERIGQHFSIRKNIAGEEGYSVFSITQQGLKVKDISVNEGQMATSYEKYQFVRPGDFAMNHMDLLTGFVGVANHLGVTSPDYRVFELMDETVCLSDYFLSIFQLCYYRKIFYGFGRGAATKGRWRMPRSSFLNFFIPIPPIEEQKKIAEFISTNNNQIENCIKGFEQQITLLHEYRTRLISDVVTGKLDVRGVGIPDYQAVEEVADAADIETDETEGEDDAD